MSFTFDVKKEASQNILKPCCRKAQLSALIQLCSTLTISSQGMIIVVKTENAPIASRILKMLKEEFKCETELSVIRKMNLKKNNIYQIRILTNTKLILDELGILTDKGLRDHPAYLLVKKECCARAYLAGAFMAMGSVNSPTKPNYHLEISTNEVSHASFIQKLMQRFEMPAKIISRRNQHVVYLKASEKIGDFLRCIGAYEALMKFEDVRIQRDFRNSYTRLDNCDIANEMKSQEAARRQLEDIQVLIDAKLFDHIDEKLVTVGRLRMQHHEANLNELCDEYYLLTGDTISKSGMKHRFKKIQDLALQVSERLEETKKRGEEK